MTIRTFALALAGCVLAVTTASAQEAEQSATQEREIILNSRNYETAASYRLDLSVPEAPAFAMLGLDSPEVATPRDMPTLSMELANLFDANGTLKPGVALTAQPFWLMNRRLTLTEYSGIDKPTGWPGDYHQVGDLERRLYARTQVSFASAQVPDAEDAVRLGVGLVFYPLNSLDPRLDQVRGDEISLTACLNAARTTLQQQTIGDAVTRATTSARNQIKGERGWTDAQLDAELARNEDLREQLDDLIQELSEFRPEVGVQAFQASRRGCISAWRDRQARQPNLMVAVGQTFLSATGRSDDLEAEGLTAWVGYSQPIRLMRAAGYTSRVNLYARYAEEEEVVTDGEETSPASVAVAAISLNLIEQQNWQFGLEASYRTEDFSDATEDREFSQVALNGAFRVNDGLWLRASYGTRGEEDDEFVRVSFVIAQRAEN